MIVREFIIKQKEKCKIVSEIRIEQKEKYVIDKRMSIR